MRIPLLVSLAAALALASCGGEEQSDYSAANSLEFFTACTEPLEDTRLVTQICDCVFAEVQVEMEYERFVEIEEEIIAAAAAAVEAQVEMETSLPKDLAAIVASCVSEEADL